MTSRYEYLLKELSSGMNRLNLIRCGRLAGGYFESDDITIFEYENLKSIVLWNTYWDSFSVNNKGNFIDYIESCELGEIVASERGVK